MFSQIVSISTQTSFDKEQCSTPKHASVSICKSSADTISSIENSIDAAGNRDSSASYHLTSESVKFLSNGISEKTGDSSIGDNNPKHFEGGTPSCWNVEDMDLAHNFSTMKGSNDCVLTTVFSSGDENTADTDPDALKSCQNVLKNTALAPSVHGKLEPSSQFDHPDNKSIGLISAVDKNWVTEPSSSSHSPLSFKGKATDTDSPIADLLISDQSLHNSVPSKQVSSEDPIVIDLRGNALDSSKNDRILFENTDSHISPLNEVPELELYENSSDEDIKVSKDHFK